MNRFNEYLENKDSSNREVEGLKKQVEELRTSLEHANTVTIDQANSFNAVRVQLDVKVINLEKQVELLLTEKRSLMDRLEELQRELENVHEQKK